MASRRFTVGSGALAALAVLFVGLTVLTGFALRGARLDLTEHRMYSISPGTQRILDSLAEPLNLYLFDSEAAAARQPALRIYGKRVREFLQEIASRSKGRIRLHVIDPQPFSEDEDRAAEFGIRAVPTGNAGTSLYLGLAGTNGTDGREVIDFFDPSKEPFLEYDVAKLVEELAQPRKPVVGWLSTVPMSAGYDAATGQAREPWLVYSQAQQLFKLRELPRSLNLIDADIDVLVLVHPRDLPQSTLYAIDQYALRGGRLLVFVDPIAEADEGDARQMPPPPGRPSSLEPLLSAWGVAFDPGEVLGDLEHGLPVTVREGEPPVRHIAILALNRDSLNAGDVITSGLTQVTVATAGILRPKKGVDVRFEPLLQSSTRAAPIPAQRLTQLKDPSTLRDDFKPTGERYTVAARVTGMVKSAFPNGAPEGVPPAAGAAPLAASARALNLVVVADVEMLTDFLWVRWQNFLGQRTPTAWANNGDLVWNALDNLAGNNDLISVRGRASFLRPFERVDALRAAAEDRFRSEQRELEHQLSATEAKLQTLQAKRTDPAAGSPAPSVILSAEQEREVQRFQKEKLRIRKELRDVQLGLDRDIRSLGSRLKLVNIVLVPAAFAALALLVAGTARRRRSSKHAASFVAAASRAGP